MKITTLTLTAAALLGTAAFAGPVEDMVSALTAEGYQNIEIEVEGKTTEIEGYLNGQEREILILTATGEVLYDKVEMSDDDDHEDDMENEDDETPSKN